MQKWEVYYYKKEDNTKPVEDYILQLPKNERAKTIRFIDLLKNNGPNLKRPYADFLRDGIHELRIKLTGTQVRILYFFCFQDRIILTNVFEKHTDEVPDSEIKIALERRADYIKRTPVKKVEEDDYESGTRS